MIAELTYNASSFEQVARLIAASESDVGWLAAGLRQWVWPQEGTPARLRSSPELGFFASIAKGRWSRKRLIRVLRKTLPDATKKVSELTTDFAVSSYLTDRQLGEGFDFLQIVQLSGLLHEIRRRCEAVSLSPGLISSPGKAKAGRSKTLAPDHQQSSNHSPVANAAPILNCTTFNSLRSENDQQLCANARRVGKSETGLRAATFPDALSAIP